MTAWLRRLWYAVGVRMGWLTSPGYLPGVEAIIDAAHAIEREPDLWFRLGPTENAVGGNRSLWVKLVGTRSRVRRIELRAGRDGADAAVTILRSDMRDDYMFAQLVEVLTYGRWAAEGNGHYDAEARWEPNIQDASWHRTQIWKK